MATAGPSLPTVAATDAAYGSVAWANADFILANDGTRATAAGVSNGGPPTVLLVGTDFDFAIPAGATINGIEVVIDRTSANAACRDSLVSLYLGGAVVGDNKADVAVQWPASLTEKTYGGPADTWGVVLTANDVNDAGFGVAVSCEKNVAAAGGPGADYLSVTVHYTEASGVASRSMMMGCGR